MYRILSTVISAVVALSLSTGAFAQGHDHAGMKMSESGTKPSAAASKVPAAFKSQLDGVYAAYLALQISLSGDAFVAVGANVRALSATIEAVDMKLLTDNETHKVWMAVSDSLTASLGKIRSAKDIEAARAGFRTLSAAIITAGTQFGTFRKTPIYIFHCPMAFNNQGADWVQAGKTTKNPYFGKTMLSCGKMTGTISSENGK